MGYADPQQNIRSYLQVMNDQTRRFTEEFDDMFLRVNNDMRSNIAANIAQIEKARLKKQVGSEDYWQAYKQARPKEGYMETRNQFLKHVGELYYGISDCGTPDCEYKQRNYEAIPSKIAEVQAVYLALKKRFDDSIGAGDGIPGGFNPATSEMVMGFIDEDAKHSYDVTDDGKLTISYSYGGKQYNIAAQDIIDLGVEGNWGVKIYGNPKDVRQTIWDGIKTRVHYDDLVSQQINTGDKSQNQYKVYKAANEAFIKQMKDPEEYKQTIEGQNGQTIMGDNWAIILNDAVDVVNDPNGDPDLKAIYKPYLDKILGGDDGKFGGADAADDVKIPGRDQRVKYLGDENIQDYHVGDVWGGTGSTSSSDWLNFYRNQGAAGVWNVTDPSMKGLAYAWFGNYDPRTSYLMGYEDPKGRVLQKGAYTATSSSSSNTNPPGTVDVNKFQLDANAWLKNQTDPKTMNNVIKNRRKLLTATPSSEKEKILTEAELLLNEIEVEKYLNGPQGLYGLGLPAKANSIYKMADNGKLYEQTIKNGKIKEYYELQKELADALEKKAQAAHPEIVKKIDEIRAKISELETGKQDIGVTIGDPDRIDVYTSKLVNMLSQRNTKIYNQQGTLPNDPLSMAPGSGTP